MGNIRHAGLGGLFPNSERSIVLAFRDLAGICSIDRAKVEVLWACLCEALHYNFQCILVEGDSACTISWASGVYNAPWLLWGCY